MIALEEANQYLDDREKLINLLMDNGYLFIKNLLTESVTLLNQNIVGLLKKYGYVFDHSDLRKPVVASKIPDRSMLSEHHGVINRKIANLQSLKEISQGGEAKQVLEKIIGTPLYPWVENKDRVRVVQPSNKTGYATAPHQDAFHFRTKFVTMWVPLTDISEAEGGLALRKLSHTEGLHEHWFRSGEYLGVADNRESASTWSKSGATVTGGRVEEDDISKVWLHSNYTLGDCLIFIPQMVHAGLPNISKHWRIPGDFRFQNKRNVMPW
jgi:ectoine hydroxylase-related dioxygenase (phytanoyl-CoA dioxygenase family)